MPTNSTTPELSDEALTEIERDLAEWSDAGKRNAFNTADMFYQHCDALCQSLRAAWTENEQLHTDSEEMAQRLMRLADRCGELITDVAALRDQLAEAHKGIESLSQTIFRSEQATRMRDACVRKVRDLADDWLKQAIKEKDAERSSNLRLSYNVAQTIIETLQKDNEHHG